MITGFTLWAILGSNHSEQAIRLVRCKVTSRNLASEIRERFMWLLVIVMTLVKAYKIRLN